MSVSDERLNYVQAAKFSDDALEKERDALASALQRLAMVQRELAIGQHELMAGQKVLAEQQGKLVEFLSSPFGDDDDDYGEDANSEKSDLVQAMSTATVEESVAGPAKSTPLEVEVASPTIAALPPTIFRGSRAPPIRFEKEVDEEEDQDSDRK